MDFPLGAGCKTFLLLHQLPHRALTLLGSYPPSSMLHLPKTEWESQIPRAQSSADPGAQPSPPSLPSLLFLQHEKEGDGC